MGINPNHPAIREAAKRGLIPVEATPPRPKTATTTAPPRLVLIIDVPVKLVSEANRGGKLRERVARKNQVKNAIREALVRVTPPGTFPLRVTITRHGTAEQDDDNNARSCKSVRDVIASWLGVDDRDRRVKWVPRQRPSWTPFVRIKVETL